MALWRRFWNKGEESVSIEEECAEFTPLSEPSLTEVLPDPSWVAALSGLSTALDPWLHDPASQSLCKAVIGPPGSGTREVVKLWGEQNSARQIAGPPRERLFDPQSDWWQAADVDPDGLLVIPELDRLYLRHHDGLDLVRSLVKQMWVSPRRLVVGCDSWAWAYLCKTVQIDAVFEPPLALMSLDGDALRAWFRPRPRGQYLVQTMRDGETLYPCENSDNDGKKAENQVANEEDVQAAGTHIFQHIAATSRGIPAVALALWRKGLYEEVARPGTQQPKLNQAQPPKSIRVRPPQDLTLPGVPTKASTREAIILHTLLLHVGLPAAILFRLVPFPVSAVLGILSELRDSGLIEKVANLWQVTLLGYPAARAFLRAEGLLVDTF